MRKINNKGYMLVEIILASVIAFGVAYFIIDLTIKLKNKNDDFFVETQVTTDQAIITNKLMDYLKTEAEDFDCSATGLKASGQTIKYKDDTIDIVDDYAAIGNIECTNDLGQVNIIIPLEVKQMSDKDYNVYINYKYEIGDKIPPEIALTVNDGNTYKKENKGIIKISDNNALMPGEYTIKYAWGTSNIACNAMSDSVKITVDSGDKEKEQEVTINNRSGDGNLYICNANDILDVADNKLALNTTKNAKMKLDNTAPTCTIAVSGSTMTATVTEANSGVNYKGWSSSYSGTNETSGTMNSTGTKTYYIKDNVGLTGTCSIDIKATTSNTTYSYTQSYNACVANSSTCPYSGGWVLGNGKCTCYSTCNNAKGTCTCKTILTNTNQVNTGVTKSQCDTLDASGEFYWCSFTGTGCASCPSGYSDYGDPSYCYKNKSLDGCSSGTRTSSGCSFSGSSCPSGKTCTSSTSYSCSSYSGYTKTSDNKYCYKIN